MITALANVRLGSPSAGMMDVGSFKPGINFDKERPFLLDFLTHADYDKQRWKDRL